MCDGAAPLEIVRADGTTETIELNRAAARELYLEAYRSAEKADFGFRSLTLTPQPKLVEIVRRSRELALEGAGRDEEE